jgi:hypothetical protein
MILFARVVERKTASRSRNKGLSSRFFAHLDQNPSSSTHESVCGVCQILEALSCFVLQRSVKCLIKVRRLCGHALAQGIIDAVNRQSRVLRITEKYSRFLRRWIYRISINFLSMSAQSSADEKLRLISINAPACRTAICGVASPRSSRMHQVVARKRSACAAVIP